jgi:methylmalonyl-CoA/ethylmalonyl-CoA epimerase
VRVSPRLDVTEAAHRSEGAAVLLGGYIPSMDNAGPVPQSLVTGVDHIGIAVPDLDAAIAWYETTLGLRTTHVETNEEQGVREAMLEAGPGGGTMIQLLAPLRPDSPIGRFLDRSGPGIQQMAYRVSDIDEACAALRTRGVRLLYGEPKRGTAGSRINFLHPKDAGGVLVELVEPGRGH